MLSKKDKDKDDDGNLAKETEKLQVNDDVMDFLAPSIAKANAMGTRASPMKMPKLDVAAAQRFPGAHEIGKGSPGPRNGLGVLSSSPSNGGMAKKRRRRPNLRVAFAMTVPEIIGEGGDEAELPVMAVGKIREHKPPAFDRMRHGSRDDNVVHMNRPFESQQPRKTERPPSPGLRRAMTHGHAREHVSPPQRFAQPYAAAPSQQQADPFADDEDDFQPKPLSRTATGWSEYTDEDKADDGFQPKPLSRTATGWSDLQEDRQEATAVPDSAATVGFSSIGRMDASADYGIGRPSFSSDDPSSAHPTLEESPERFRQYDQVPDRAPTLPEIDLVASESPTEYRKASIDARHWLAASPTDPNSFSAKLIHKMKAEEGRALHDYVRNSVLIDENQLPNFDSGGSLNAAEQAKSAHPSSTVSRQDQTAPTLQQPRPPMSNAFSYQHPSTRPPLPPQASYPPSQPPQQRLQVSDSRLVPNGNSPVPPAHMSLTPRDHSPASTHSTSTRPTPSPMASASEAPGNYFPQQTYQQTSSLSQHVPYVASSKVASQPQSLPTSQSHPSISQSQQQPLQSYALPSSLPPSQKPPGQAPPSRGAPRSLATRLSESVTALPSPTNSSIRSRDSDVSFVMGNYSQSSMTGAAALAGEAALDDFAERVQHMSGIFRLTAEVIQPATKYTAKQWLRCCLWWFLRGRAGLEALMQSRQREQRSSPVENYSDRPVSVHTGQERLCQAHVDLAKVVWMLYEIFPALPVMHPYTQGAATSFASPSTIAAAREANDVEAVQVLENMDAVGARLRTLLASCSKNGGMPPHSSLIQGQDQSIWVQFPTLSRDVAQFISVNQLNNPLETMPVADTRTNFAYGRMFVNVTISTPSERFETASCILSIMRERNTWGLKVAVCSQTDAFTLIVQDEHERAKAEGWGPGWKDVQWDPQRSRVIVDLMGSPGTPASATTPQTPRGRFSALIEFTEADYVQLVNIWSYTRSVSSSMLASRDERYVYEVVALSLRYSEETNMRSSQHQQRASFPTESVTRCRIRVFEKFETVETDTGSRKLHRGFRILAVTSPKVKSLSAVSVEVGNTQPITCEMTNDEASGQPLPALTLRNASETSQTSLFMVFNDQTERQALMNLITGVTQSKDEHVACVVRLTSLLMEEASIAESYTHNYTNPLRSMRWQDAMLILEDESELQSLDDTAMTEKIRIVARGQGIGFTERMNLAPGELKIRLPATGTSSTPSASLSILRPYSPAPSTTITAISSHPDPGVGGPLASLLAVTTQQMTAQNYHFPGLNDLHKFEAALTGHDVMFDALASAFTISHRIALVPIHKRHGAHDVRIQVLRREGDSSALLLAFFEGFALAEAVCFKLLSTNVYELVDGDKKSKKDSEKESGSWRYGVKLVDAKFSMPRLRREKEDKDQDSDGGWRKHRRDKSKDLSGGKESRAGEREAPIGPDKIAERFVSVDMLEYAGEHDDIVIGFESELGKYSCTLLRPLSIG